MKNWASHILFLRKRGLTIYLAALKRGLLSTHIRTMSYMYICSYPLPPPTKYMEQPCCFSALKLSVIKTECQAGGGFRHLLMNLANVNAFKTMFACYYCIKTVPHAFNSQVSTSTNPCINKTIHVLLMHGFSTLNILVPGH